jgi:hypothetical protein
MTSPFLLFRRHQPSLPASPAASAPASLLPQRAAPSLPFFPDGASSTLPDFPNDADPCLPASLLSQPISSLAAPAPISLVARGALSLPHCRQRAIQDDGTRSLSREGAFGTPL